MPPSDRPPDPLALEAAEAEPPSRAWPWPASGLSYHRMQDTRLRRAICRAYDVFAADRFRGLQDRVIPAALK